jgi:hypothetical protein
LATYNGLYRAVILAVNDPAGEGRVQVLVPAISGQTSGWAMPCMPPGQSQQANVGDLAWIMFEGGNPAYPVFMGIMKARV